MAKPEDNWPPRDMAKFVADYNRRAFLDNFPPEHRWQTIEGLLVEDRSALGDTLVSIQGRDHNGDDCRLWVDLPNAMYLLGFLQAVQRDTGASIPQHQPGMSQPHPSD